MGASGFSFLTLIVRPCVLRLCPMFGGAVSEISFKEDVDDVMASGAMIALDVFFSSVVAAFPLMLLRRPVTPLLNGSAFASKGMVSSPGSFLVLRRIFRGDVSSVAIVSSGG